jgi:hypothetical protein
MRIQSSTSGRLALLMGVLGTLAFLFMWKANPLLAKRLVANESFVDLLSATFWLIASLICFYRIKNNSQSNKLLLYFWAIFCFLCAAEELKWGYRIFHYHNYYLQNINYQHDISLHNLTLTKKWFISPQHLFYLGFFIYFLVMPFLTLSKKIKPIKDKLHYITPSINFMLATWIPILFSTLIIYVFTPRTPLDEYYRIIFTIAETREMFCAFVVLFYVYLYLPPDFQPAAVVKPLVTSKSWQRWPKRTKSTNKLANHLKLIKK